MIVGYVDRVERGWISGWAADTEQPNRVLDIGLICRSRLLTVSQADQQRDDVLAAGIGHGQYGFALSVPSGIGVTAPDEVEIVVLPEGTRVAGGAFVYDAVLDDLNRVAANLPGLIPAIPALEMPPIPEMSVVWHKLCAEYQKKPGGVAISAGLAHNLTCARNAELPVDGGAMIALVINWLLRSRHLPPWTRLSLLPVATLRALCEPVLARPEAWGPVSRFAYYNSLAANGPECAPCDWQTRSGWEAGIVRFGLTPLIDASLPAVLLSAQALELLALPGSGFRTDQAAWSALWALCHKIRHELPQKVDASRPLDRLTYALGTLVKQLIAGGDGRLHPDFMTRFWLAPTLDTFLQPCISRFEYVVVRAFGPADLKAMPGRSLIVAEAARRWVDGFIGANHRGRRTQAESEENKLYLVGYHESEAGLGRNLAMSLRAFAAIGIEVTLMSPDGLSWRIPIPAGVERRQMKRNVVIHHVNADAIPLTIMQLGDRLPIDCVHIGFCLWELSSLPTQHLLALEILDEIWVPTQFVAEIYAKKFERRVRVVGKGIAQPLPNRTLDRSRFNLPRDAFVCLVIFDFDSSLERKNPLAAIRAFQLAWGADSNALCVIKVTNRRTESWLDPHETWSQIVTLAASDHRIIVLDLILPYPDLLRLIELSDVLVSLHRSEGFGYNIADAMALGRPVVVTDYSGNKDFCDPDSAWLVPSTTTAVEAGSFIFDAPGAVWAEPDVQEAAHCLSMIRSDPIEAERRAQNACRVIATHYSDAAQSERYLANLIELAVT